MGKGKIRLIGAPPASGKSAVKAALEAELGSGWLVLEHEQVFTPEQRVKTAEMAKIELNSKEFVLGANLPGQLAFQALLRSIADTGMNVVGMGPFENVWGEIDGVPLWRKMKTEDFGSYDLNLVYFLVSLHDHDRWGLRDEEAAVMGQDMDSYWKSLETEIQRRLRGRATKSPYQKSLDADKVGKDGYYRSRADHVLRSAYKFGLPILPYCIDTPPWMFAKVLAKVLAKALSQ